MKRKSLFLIMSCSVFVACAQPVAVPENSTINIEKILPAYFWSYQPLNDNPPIKLNFAGEGIGIDTGCNHGGVPYKIQDEKLFMVPQTYVSTAMGCLGALAEQEILAINLFDAEKQQT